MSTSISRRAVTLVANDTSYSLLPHIFKKLPFDHEKDLVPVAAYVLAPMALAVDSQSRFKSRAPRLTSRARRSASRPA